MAQALGQQRYKCALAAIQTVHAIDKAIPILHSGAGCAGKLDDSFGNSGFISPQLYPCTCLGEKEIVFGGNDKLAELIENSLKIMDGDLFVVLSGCAAEIIGDDIEDVISNFDDNEKPVVSVKTPGFKGNNYLSHDWVLKAIFDKLVIKSDKKQKGLVNILAGPPYQDPFWEGNLRALEKLVSLLGLTPNTIFGHAHGIENIKRLGEAEFTLLVSPWVGYESAKFLEDKFGVPLLHYSNLPMGAYETSKFLKTVGEFAKLDPAFVDAITKEREAEYYYYIDRFAPVFLELRVMSKRFAIVSDAQYAVAVTRFLVNDMGMFPTKVYVSDDTPVKYRAGVVAAAKELNYGVEADVQFSTDGYAIHDDIEKEDFGGSPLIFGSSWERFLAAKVGGHFLPVSYPIEDKLIINNSYVGYDGGLQFIGDFYSVGLQMNAVQ
ncbi:MAG: hydrogenase [Oscillospiraceae bacterium]|jgi:nitrogenase molybdenum-iron protein beta chain|nr:hydrogenase [Oscillospiraceae bacterium]